MPDAVPRLPVAAGCHSGRGGPGGPRLAALVPVALRSRPPTARIDFSSFGAVPGLGSGSQSRDSESHGGSGEDASSIGPGHSGAVPGAPRVLAVSRDRPVISGGERGSVSRYGFTDWCSSSAREPELRLA